MRRVFSGLFLAFLILSLVVIVVAKAFDRVSERSVTYRYLSEALNQVPADWTAATWLPAEVELVRPFTDVDAERIGFRLTEAWRSLAQAQFDGDPAVLQDSFSGVALRRALLSVEESSKSGGRMVVLSITARPIFFHLDGSVLQAETEMIVSRFVERQGQLVHEEVTIDTGVVTLMNETTGWRVFMYELGDSRPLAERNAAWQIERLQGFNYYPPKTPWDRFWPEFDPLRARADMSLIRRQGANAVRIFLPSDVFARPSPRDLSALSILLRMAQDEGLRVIPTLFDMPTGYAPTGWLADAEMLRQVLPILAASPAVAVVDIKNEPDLDFDSYGRPLVEAWLNAMLTIARETAPDLPLTIGWSNPEEAARYAGMTDVVSYHDFLDPSGMRGRLDGIRASAAPKPVIVSEIGASSWSALLGWPGSERRQANLLNRQLDQLSGADGLLLWTLHDFPREATHEVTNSYWSAGIQSGFGLFRLDGSEKPAAEVVRQAFGVQP